MSVRAAVVALALTLLACDKAPPAAPPPKPTALADLLPAGTDSVMRANITSFPMAQFLATEFHTRSELCWTKLESSVRTTYQLMMSATHDSVFVLDGDLVPADVEACVKQVLAQLDVTVEHDADNVDHIGIMGKTVDVAWRPPFVVIGSQRAVHAALAGTPPSSPWRARIAELAKQPPYPMSLTSDEPAFGYILQIPSTSWDLALTETSQAPDPVRIAGTVTVHTPTHADAELGAAHLAAGDIQFITQLPDTLVGAIRKLHTTVDGTQLTIAFDAASFANMDLGQLGALYAKLQTMVPPKSATAPAP